jgi:hypothetical protein
LTVQATIPIIAGLARVAIARTHIAAGARTRCIEDTSANELLAADVGISGPIAAVTDIAVLRREGVAVIVRPVTLLSCTREARAISVVTIAVALGYAVAIRIIGIAGPTRLVDVSVAIVVDTIA